MKSALTLLCAAAALAAGCSSGPSKPARSGGSVYVLKAHEFEGCECDSVCPCLFQKDTSHGDCKVLMAWSVSEGHYQGTNLAGVNFAVAITKSGANMEKNMGKWTGVLYHSDKSSEAQKSGAFHSREAVSVTRLSPLVQSKAATAPESVAASCAPSSATNVSSAGRP